MKRMRVMAAVAISVLGVTAATPAAASAAPTGPGSSQPEVASSSDEMGTQSYSDCPYGRACLFYWENGGTPLWYAPSCGWHTLSDYGVQNWARSIRTQGNPVDVYFWGKTNSPQRVPAWTQGGLNYWDEADEIYVRC
ncbi:hypothetical protein [Micromonospora siamensis]|uniref:Peptidase inhibitor family I36 n=1 Tax=Micromonospora siamensis TaxID=299152 RepID=A0A1C5IW64_9ACTN|nr:hypothetical protein [Micromonospora siamensis]SCG62413.1 hypothetical protein GA0074704_3861 [Micromonospora siamensis]